MSIIKEQRIIDYSKAELREIFTTAGLNTKDIERAIVDYFKYRERELSRITILSTRERRDLGAESLAEAYAEEFMKARQGYEIVEDILAHYQKYVDYKKQIAKLYEETKDWDKIITTLVYVNIIESQESFIDFVEETYQTKVKDGLHLQELTNITEETLEGLEETVLLSRLSKYFRALEVALQGGAKYKDLFSIKPKEFELPDTWAHNKSNNIFFGKDQESCILGAINSVFQLGDIVTIYAVNLRAIAKELEAPFSVIMRAREITWKL